MKRIAAIVLGSVLFVLAIHTAGAARSAGSRMIRSPASGALTALDPYLVAPNNLGDIDLSTFLAGNPNLADYSAANLAADGTSAAIALFETNSLSDVTFSVVDGTATLLPYATNFLTQPPQSGSQTLVVTSASFIHANGNYYVPVLLQGPLGGYTTANSIAVTAGQDGNSTQANLGLVVPPLVLVHGLWGDKSSLEDLEDYVDSIPLWKSQTQLVVPICYSLYLAFDATYDPLSGGTCEVTSESALQTEVDSLMAELDSEHIVGGRVDIAAHSMGGLATRNYASQSSYASLRNRMQGQFHNIVTIDTPEIGSRLANYLVSHRDNKRRASKDTPQGFIWWGVCGNTDVETCFAANGYPLAGPGLPINTGGVYSLEPGSPSLTNPSLVGPKIANTTWRAVSATAPGNSALAIGLDTLIAALYSNPDGKNVPTVNTILGSVPNDAIVTVKSQTKAASGTDQYYTFAKLSHTSLVSSILTWLSGYNVNDNSVTDDPSNEVNSLTACWLAWSGTSGCLPQEAQSPSVEPAAPTIVLKPVDRIALLHAPHTVVLGTPFELAVHLRAAGATPRLFAYERGEEGHSNVEPVVIARSDGNTVYARVTPKLLGPMTLGISAAFSDGGVSAGRIETYVMPPKGRPLAFKANELPTLVMTMNLSSRTAMPHPFAVYPAPVGRVDLDSNDVTWRLVAQKSGSVVTLDSKGMLHAVKPGEAVVEARFGSSVARVRVLVRAEQQ